MMAYPPGESVRARVYVGCDPVAGSAISPSSIKFGVISTVSYFVRYPVLYKILMSCEWNGSRLTITM